MRGKSYLGLCAATVLLFGCASAPNEKEKKAVSIDTAQELIESGKVRWVVEPNTGCGSIYLHTGETYCWRPADFDLLHWVIDTGNADNVEGLIIE